VLNNKDNLPPMIIHQLEGEPNEHPNQWNIPKAVRNPASEGSNWTNLRRAADHANTNVATLPDQPPGKLNLGSPCVDNL
jgi:hypothetical protein